MGTLYELTGEYLALSDMLMDDEVDEQTVIDTLEGVKGEIEIKAEGYVKVLRSIESQAEAYEREAELFANKAKTVKNRADSLKKALFNAMTAMDIPEIKTDLFKLKIVGNGGMQPLEVTDVIDDIPDEFIRIKKEADKKAIGEYLKSLPEDVEVSWAKLLPRGRHLSIK